MSRVRGRDMTSRTQPLFLNGRFWRLRESGRYRQLVRALWRQPSLWLEVDLLNAIPSR